MKDLTKATLPCQYSIIYSSEMDIRQAAIGTGNPHKGRHNVS